MGVLKAIHCGQPATTGNRITKDTVIFNASDFPALVEKLQLDLHEPPMSQVRIEFTIATFCIQHFQQYSIQNHDL